MASKLGFYSDDWQITYYYHFFGPSIFKQVFAVDRPLLAWFYILMTSWLGEVTLKFGRYLQSSRAGYPVWLSGGLSKDYGLTKSNKLH